MGEGWSDIMAMMVLAKSSDTATTRVTIGAYIYKPSAGIRSHPYTTDMRVNPLTYVDMRPVLSPCYSHATLPSLSARNAIITADVNHYGGANKCEIYKAFAKRGLGSEATNLSTNDFSVPSECQ
ncbi:hypothetical protein BASA50_010766 [Batrachochytrium salamandrivorans]|uniref:Extracellular metalloproteinase n=1 Tax=Batrachochytrium salamandrivorans TaxID=1357716 RepID=A0ABQ8EXP8_9FUNG|nr:hypothetical protein BASA50_010766 [Batrachochytrium salamandrivorans]